MTSSSQAVKEELAHYQPSRRCCRLAELSSLIHMEGVYRIRGSKGHSVATESTDVRTARKIYTLLHILFNVETPMVKIEQSTPCKRSVYRIEIPDQVGFHQILNELGILDSSLVPEPSIPPRLVRNECCVAAAMRGAFLGGGYISEPHGLYDFEIAFSSMEAAGLFCRLFRRKGLDPGVRQRRTQWVLYMKSMKTISEFLAITGAHGAYLDWESRMIINSTRNRVNRLVNCDQANVKRLTRASLRQREAIEKLKSAGMLDGLDPFLQEIAEVRLLNPQASMSEIGQMLEPPVSKSVVQGRMRRLEALAEPGD